MVQVLTIVHECADYDRWKAAYDADAGNRKAAGLAELMLARQSEKPAVIALVFSVADLSRAKLFVNSAELRDVMQKAGISGAPEVHFRQGEFARGTGADVLTINCRISSIETFRKGFAMDKADRVAAGLADLAVLQDSGNPNDLLVAFGVSDVAKAREFLASPALAEHQVRNAGVMTPPQIRYWKLQ